MLATFCAFFKRPFSFGHWLSLFTLGNSLLMTAITLGLGDWAGLLMSGIYLPLAMLIHLTFITSLISLGIFAIVKLGKLSRSGYWLSALVFSLALILVVTNFKVYELYHFHLNGVVLNFIFSGALMENLAFSWVMWVNLALILIAVLGVQTLLCLAAALLASKVYGRRFTKSAIAICISLILGLQLLNGFADAMAWRNILAQNRFIPWMPSVTMRKSLRNLGLPVVDSKSQDLQVKAGALNYPLQPLSCNTDNPPNILMLVVDSLRFDMLTPDIMPETSQFAARAIRFDNHYSTGNATRNGMFGLMYGLNASYWQAMLRQEQGSILFDLTLAQDYQHFIYGSTKLTFPEFDRTIFSRLREQLVKGSHKSSADNDREITQRLINDLENADKQRE